MKARRLISLLFLVLSCMREAPLDTPREGEIRFAVAETKAQLLENAAAVASAYGTAGIGLIAYSYSQPDAVKSRYPDGDEAWNSFDYASRKAYKLTRNSSGVWNTDVHSLRWSREVNFLEFFAFAPFDLPVTSGEHSLPVIAGLTVDDPATQADILVADVPDYNAMPSVVDQKVPLVFSHPLAALQIRNLSEKALSGVELRGVKDRASAYSFSDNTWTLEEHTVTYSLSNVAAGETSQKYLLLPQDLSGITLRFVAGGKTVEAPLSGRWEPGQLFTYTVDDRVWEYVLDIPVTRLNLAFGATEDVLAVESYKSDGYNKVQAGWTVRYYSDAACQLSVAKPSWLTVNGNATAGEPGTASSLTITSVENNEGGVEQIQGDEAIRKATEKGLWNLANRNGTYGVMTESANCYIVNSPGWYVIPLVMGNAISGGSWNYAAFRGMTDYKGNLIQNDARLGGWTQNPSTGAGVRSGVPTTAKVLWEDVNGLIYADSDYVLPPAVSGASSAVYGSINPQNGNSMYQLFFYVPTWLGRMKGNAVIGVFDADGLLMWSWHIWVTDYVPGQGDVTVGGARYMPQNIGEVRYANKYPEHTVYVKVTSEGNSGLSRVIRVVKAGGEGTQMTRSYNPYYQHGRKDPFIPGIAGSLDNLPVYGVNSLVSYTEVQSAIRSGGGLAAQLTVGEAIQHPNYFGASTGGSYAWYWTSAAHTNFWGATKTIYDPSPVGYHVPSSAQLESLAGSGLVIPLNNRRSSNPGDGHYPGTLVLNNGAQHAALWSSDVDGTNNARYLRVQGNGHTIGSVRGREALSVRAVAD